jgi:hypothetical protein
MSSAGWVSGTRSAPSRSLSTKRKFSSDSHYFDDPVPAAVSVAVPAPPSRSASSSSESRLTREVGVAIPMPYDIKFYHSARMYNIKEWPEVIFFEEEEDPFDESDNNSRTVTRAVVNWETEFESSFLGQGSYGKVWLLKNAKQMYALKRFPFSKRNSKSTLDELKWVQDDRVKDVMIPAKVYTVDHGDRYNPPEYRYEQVILMQVGEKPSTLLRKSKWPHRRKTRKSFRETTVNGITRGILSLQTTLIENGVLYTDVKRGNLMVTPHGKNKVRLMFADYGGLCEYGSQGCVFTYTPPEGLSSLDTSSKALQAAKWMAATGGNKVGEAIKGHNKQTELVRGYLNNDWKLR